MKIGILANSLSAALGVYQEARAVAGSEVFLLMFPAPDESSRGFFLKQFARLLLKRGRRQSLRAIVGGKVFFFHQPLEHAATTAKLRSLKLDIGLHKSGAIYREATISAFRDGILNSHIGLLPHYRGRSVMEWSLLRGDPVGVSVFFLDSGIDTGERIVLSEEVAVSHCDSLTDAKQYLFNLDGVFYRRALELLRSENVNYQINDGSGKRYYVMSKLFQGVAEECRRSAIANN